MKTGIVKGRIQSPQPQGEFEDATAESSVGNQASSGPVAAMIACNVVLLLMLAA